MDLWHYEYELRPDDGPMMAVRAVALCNGTKYRSKAQRITSARRRLACALCLHSLSARLVTLMYNQRSAAFDVIRRRSGVSGGQMVALQQIGFFLDRYACRMAWSDEKLREQWHDYQRALSARLVDLYDVEPSECSPFFANYHAKLTAINSVVVDYKDVENLLNKLPEQPPAQQLDLF